MVVTNPSTESKTESRFSSDPSVNAANAASPTNRNSGFTIAFSTAPESLRSCRVKTFYLPERWWQVHRVISPGHAQQSSKVKVGRGLSSLLTCQNPDPYVGGRNGLHFELFAES